MTRTTVRTTRLLAVVGLVGASLALATGVGATAPCSSGNITAGPSGWERIGPPHFATPGKLTTFAVGRSTAGRIYATNGTDVQASGDGGCTWRSAFTTPEAPTATFPFSAATATITSIVTTPTRRVYLVVADTVHPHVVASDDGARSWRTVDTGLLDGSGRTRAPELVASPSPGTLYLLAHGVQAGPLAVGSDVLYVSTDDGASWQPRVLASGTVVPTAGAPSFNALSVDPTNADRLWAGTSSGLLRSNDAGASWEPVTLGGYDPMSMVSVAHDVGAHARLIAFESARTIAYHSADDGSSWSAFDVPARVDAVTTGADSRDSAISAGGGVYQLARDALAWTELSKGLPPVQGVTSDAVRHSSVYACSCDAAERAIWRHDSLSAPKQPPFSSQQGFDGSVPLKDTSQCMPNALSAPDTPDWGRPRLAPESQQLVLTPGSTRKVHYAFRQPPKEMDVFLATTTGPKSEFSHCPFKFGMVDALRVLSQVRNLRSGFADIGDFPSFTNLNDYAAIVNPSAGAEYSYAYKLERRIGPIDQDLFNAIAAQKSWWDGGGPDGDQADLAVLYQAATGVGQVVGPAVAPTYRIAGGLQAGFNDYAYKVIVHLAGSYFNTPSRKTGYPGPEFGPVEQTLRAHDIHHLGIWINNRLNKQDTSYQQWDGRLDMARLSRATGALAPGTIDCDRDGFVDLRAGDPMLCTYIAPAEGDFQSRDPVLGIEMRRMLEVLTDHQPIRVKPLSGGGSVERLTPGVYPGVDALLGHRFGFDVTFHCGVRELNQTKVVRLGAYVGDWLLATASTTLVCGTPALPEVHHPAAAPPFFPPPVPPVLNPGPGPNPVINPGPNPAPNPAQAPQAQPQPVAHPAAVPQMQEEPQLALQRASKELQADQPMTALPESAPPDAIPRRLMTFGGVFLMVCAAGLSRRVAYARAYARRPR